MRRSVVWAACLFFLAAVPVVRGQVVVPDEGGRLKNGGGIEEMDPARERACACCQECQAATGANKGKDEGPPKTSGCRDCCKKCGKKQPTDKTMPPDVVR